MANKRKQGQKLKPVWMILLGICGVAVAVFAVSHIVKKAQAEKNSNQASISLNDVKVDNIGEVVKQDDANRAPATVELMLSDCAVAVGTTFKAVAVVTPAGTQQSLIWTSNNTEVFDVTQDGIVTVKGVGTAVLTATVGTVSDAVAIEGIANISDGSSNNLPVYDVAQDSSTPSGGNSTPSGGNSTPSGGNSTPSGGSSTPNGGSSTPSGGSSTPNGGSSTPNGGSSTPSGGSSTPSGGNSTPSGGNSTPSGGNSTPSGGNSTPSGGNSTPSGGSSTPSGGNSTPSGGNSTPSGGSSTPSGGNTTPSGGSSTPSEENTNPSGSTDKGADSTQIGEYLPDYGFGQMYSNVYECRENGVYCGQIVTQPNNTIVYIMKRSDGFDIKIQEVLAKLLPKAHGQVWNTYVSAATDTTFTAEDRMVRIVMAQNGGHSQIVIYNLQ